VTREFRAIDGKPVCLGSVPLGRVFGSYHAATQ